MLCGPILRHCDPEQLTVWLVTSRPESLAISLGGAEHELSLEPHVKSQQQTIQIGQHAYIHLLSVRSADLLRDGHRYAYRVMSGAGHWQDTQPSDSSMYYAGQEAFYFVYQRTISQVLHGSCRKPHFEGADALANIDNLLNEAQSAPEKSPSLLMMSGDQIYADDVAGPTLHAIRQVIQRLGLHHEVLNGATLESSADLDTSEHNFYQREMLLPQTEDNSVLGKVFFRAKRKPIFTSVNAKNHLIALSEMLAMYLLVWSPVLWRYLDLRCPEDRMDAKFAPLYQRELDTLSGFTDALPAVARSLAHVPTYMIFDDHDVSDDWNLTRRWEEAVYSHPLSKRMIGNALTAYWLCQGWGNMPHKFQALYNAAQDTFTPSQYQRLDNFIAQVLDFDAWHYCIDTSPPVYVMDTRTRRWRSESNPDKPSGLLDWEALCEFQQRVIGKPAVIVVSAAPIFGLKFIEAVQKVFTAFGLALVVDAENWMAHKGTAQVILNIFKHVKTPPQFIILSGDVHYSFVYDVTLRFKRHSPKIVQFTCSGFKNAFPTGLLTWFDRLNSVFYSKRSPLNYFTRRRNMRIVERDPDPVRNQHVVGDVVNGAAVGQLCLSASGEPTHCRVLLANGDVITFKPEHD
ncbi:alkaline phosphatase family protein [Alteromonas sp. SM 2104]|nr:alkaline phosphatase family protein [Alteromonas oceanisediminis]